MRTFLNTAIFRILRRYGSISFHPMDLTVIGYLGILGILIVPFHNHVPLWPLYPLMHLALVFLLLEFLRFAGDRPPGWVKWLRTFYPVLLLPFAWSELNNLVTMIFPYWANELLVRLDVALFGVHPTVWVQNLFSPWLTELMNFFYWSYFLFIPVGGLTLYLKGRQRETLDFIFFTVFTYSIAFLLFLFFPAEGPWVILKDLHTVEPEGFLFLRINQFMQGNGSIRGGCFPSSHVAAAFSMSFATARFQPRLGVFYFIFAIGINLGTVYCRYHHAVDGIAGMLLGTVLYFIAAAILKKWRSGTAETTI